MSVIEISDLTRDYGNSQGIFDVDINVEKGQVYGFLGPNGAGKTTTIRHLMGFIKPQKGTCKILGMDCWSEYENIQQRLGYIPGENSFFEDMSAKDYFEFISSYRKDSAQRKKELIDRFELDIHLKIKRMSKGNKQKVALVSAFMHDPEILILDEPTSGLDPLMQHRFVELIEEERKADKTILMSSHIFEEVERTCQRVGIIRQGRIVVEEAMETLRERHLNTYTVELSSVDEAKAFARDFSGQQDGKNVTVQKSQSLEEIFIQYYGGDQND